MKVGLRVSRLRNVRRALEGAKISWDEDGVLAGAPLRFRSLSNPGVVFPCYLFVTASISEPENITTHISYGLRENFPL